MAKRPLPSLQDAQLILSKRRTRPPRKPPPPAGRSLAPLIKALDERFGQGAGGLKARWPEIVGETLARRSEPAKLVKGRSGAGAALEIKVEGAMATLIQHQSADIMARVNLYLGEGAVTRLRIIQGPIGPAAAKAGKPPPTPKRMRARPLDAASEAELEQSVEGASDPRLRAILAKLGRAVLGREPERR